MTENSVPGQTWDPETDDPFRWLEDATGDDALNWVRERNATTAAGLRGDERFGRMRAAILDVLDSDAKIPEAVRIGDVYYNFWRDGEHERGLWRQTTPESYREDEPDWETVLDLDALAAEEGISWVWHGAGILRPAPGRPWRHALVELSSGGSDADVSREFNLVERRFVPESEGGFVRPEAKGGMAWIDADTVYAFTDTGPGSLTQSGYPRTVRRWRRGTPLAEAPVVFEGAESDLYISAWHDSTPGFERDFVLRSKAFYSQEVFWLRDPGTPEEKLVRIDVPDSAEVSFHREWMLIELRDEWSPAGTAYPAGSLLAAPFDDLVAGSRAFTVLFTPTPHRSLAAATWTRRHLVINALEDVSHRLSVLTPPAADAAGRTPAGTAWTPSPFPWKARLGTVGARAVDNVDSDDIWLITTDFLSPTTLSIAGVGGVEPPTAVKTNPAFFDSSGLVAEQHFATSADGTRVPYFVVRPADLAPGGTAPTLLYGYGGFEVSLTPGYSGTLGRAWLSQGGVYVVANIRGGGEYGPAWHQAALQGNRHRAYEDFAAVARDLIDRGLTAPEHLGVEGRSNGGLLAGNMLTGHPELFGAIIVGSPLLDMRRYTELLAGASWIAEYGDPDDPQQWEFIRSFSPYHRIAPDRDYPPVLFTTSTKDDRVHPGHARKMAAALLAAGKDVTYYENIEGGHGGAATNAQAAHMAALHYRFLWERLT